MQRDDFVIFRPGAKIYARTAGFTCWAPFGCRSDADVRRRADRNPFAIPTVVRRWRPPHSAGRDLRGLHAAAIRMAATRPQLLVDARAAHGLKQQLLHTVLACLAATKPGDEVRAERRDQQIMAAFQQVLQSRSGDPYR